MAAPNLAAATNHYLKAAVVALTSTDMTSVVSNAASSGKVLKVTSLYVANIDGTNTCDVSVELFSQDDIGGTGTGIANTIPVPADATLIVIGKDAPIYLEEDKSLGAKASAADDLEIVCSYEEIS